METLIPSLAALGIAVSVSSVASLVAVLILLELPGGLRRAVAFIAGWVAMIAVITLALELFPSLDFRTSSRSEERRVGKGCSARRWRRSGPESRASQPGPAESWRS